MMEATIEKEDKVISELLQLVRCLMFVNLNIMFLQTFAGNSVQLEKLLKILPEKQRVNERLNSIIYIIIIIFKYIYI